MELQLTENVIDGYIDLDIQAPIIGTRIDVILFRIPRDRRNLIHYAEYTGTVLNADIGNFIELNTGARFRDVIDGERGNFIDATDSLVFRIRDHNINWRINTSMTIAEPKPQTYNPMGSTTPQRRKN